MVGAYYAHYLHILTPEPTTGVPIIITILVITSSTIARASGMPGNLVQQ